MERRFPGLPGVGRIVHYVLPLDSPHAGEHRAAIVAESVGVDEYLTLTVCKAHADDRSSDPWRLCGCSTFPAFFVPHDAEGAPGTWHWPERDDAPQA